MPDKKVKIKVAGLFPTHVYHSFEETFDSEDEMLDWWEKFKAMHNDIRDLHLIEY